MPRQSTARDGRQTDQPDKLLRPASRRSQIDSFIVMDVMRAAAARESAGASVIHMEVGQPATSAPDAARHAAAGRIESEKLGYTLALGMPELRARIAALYDEWYGVKLSPERVVITTGSSAGFLLSFMALFDVGDRVALPSPGYPCYRHILTSLGQRPVLLDTGPATRWMPTPEAIAEAADAEQLSGVLIASPANPTGTMLEPERLAAITKLCRQRGIWFISDEIYHGLTWSKRAHSALESSDDVIVINSFSKYFSMTGWRVGWMVVPEALVPSVERLAQNLFISAPAVSQVAAIGAFEGRDELEANRAVYEANRNLLLTELPKAGLDRIVPADGAFYLYVDISQFTNDSLAFTRDMLAEIGIAATPGIDFDPEHGRHFVRFSYAGSTAEMAQAASRLAGWDRLKR